MGKRGPEATGQLLWNDCAACAAKVGAAGICGCGVEASPRGVRVTLAGGKRRIIPFDPGTTAADARMLAPVLARRAQNHVDATSAETVTEWSERWIKARRDKGLASVKEDERRLSKHILPVLGPMEMRAVTRAHLEDLVAKLDGNVRVGEYSWRTAVHVWGNVSRMFKDACGSKRRDLRVREDNPAEKVAPPERGVKKAKVYLYPSEVLALVSSSKVPLRWRRLFAIGSYTYMRTGELEALEWGDVDLEHGTIHVHRAVDRVRARGKTKATKTNVARKIPIEPTLAPLLAAMREEAGGENARGAVLKMPSPGMLSRKLKFYLERVGVKRADLFTSDATRKAITFYDATRATGITWMAIRGDDEIRIMRRAGHAHITTTLGYIREAEHLGAGAFGVPFPPLPADLIDPIDPDGNQAPNRDPGSQRPTSKPNSRGVRVGATGFEPVTSSV